MHQIKELTYVSTTYKMVAPLELSRNVLRMKETSILSGSKEQLQVVRPALHSKGMRTKQEINYYYLHPNQPLKPALMALKSHAVFMSMFFIHQHLMTFIYFARQTRGVLRSMRFKSLGLNKLTRQCRRRRNAGISKFCGTFCPGPRVRPKSRRPNFTDRRKQSPIHSFRAVSGSKTICIPERLVSRTLRWDRNYSKQCHSIHYRHDAADGRQSGCYLQPNNQNFIDMLGG